MRGEEYQYPLIMQGQVWVSPQVFEWEMESSGASGGESLSSQRRSYQTWVHADHLIQAHDDEHYLSDAIVALHRVVDYRVRRLNELYKFRRIPINDKPADLWELLNYLGIIRPRMFAQLKELRRGIEHFGKGPPPQDRCAELSEFVWYFLQCTDRLVRAVTDEFGLAVFDMSEHHFGAQGGPMKDWCFDVHGRFPPEFICASQEHGWLEVKNTRARTLDDDFGSIYIFQGTIAGPSEGMDRLIRLYFDVRQ
jgi:hypothetical protein